MMNDSPALRQPELHGGLCGTCRHGATIANDRGRSFLRCERSRTDAAYPRYPVLPVLVCRGYEPAEDC